MTHNNVLQWLDGRGWLVLSGGGEYRSDIRAQALARSAADGGVAYVTLGSHSALGEQALNDMEDLGAPSGYLVDVISEDDQTIQSKLAEAGIVVIEGEAGIEDMRAGLIGAAADGIQSAFQNGAVVLVEGNAAAVFGAWILIKINELTSGLAWLENSLVMPGITSVAESGTAQNILMRQPAALAVGIGAGSALALGPDGEVETWGARQVTIALGKDYSL